MAVIAKENCSMWLGQKGGGYEIHEPQRKGVKKSSNTFDWKINLKITLNKRANKTTFLSVFMQI